MFVADTETPFIKSFGAAAMVGVLFIALASCSSQRDEVERATILNRIKGQRKVTTEYAEYTVRFVASEVVWCEVYQGNIKKTYRHIVFMPDPNIWIEGSMQENCCRQAVDSARLTRLRIAKENNNTGFFERVLEKGSMHSLNEYVSFRINKSIISFKGFSGPSIWPIRLDHHDFIEGVERTTGKRVWSMITVDSKYFEFIFRSYTEQLKQYAHPRDEDVHLIKAQDEMNDVIRGWIRRNPGFLIAAPELKECLKGASVNRSAGFRKSP